MDDASFAKLHSKVYMRGFGAGSTIYERDTPSETAYIVLHGSVSVRNVLTPARTLQRTVSLVVYDFHFLMRNVIS